MPKFLDVTNKAAARDVIDAVGRGELVVNFADYGACDGVTNDRAAFASALNVLSSAGGGTLLLPPKSIAITMNADPTFTVPANTRIVGVPGATAILLSSTANDSYVAFAGNDGDNVTFENITFLRNANCTGMIFHLQGGDGFHVRNCVINGRTDLYDKAFHGFALHSDGDKRNITIKDSAITRVSYGLLQGNGTAGDIDTIVVDNCHFSFNYGDDLEFNAPLSAMTNVMVSNCRFTDMQGTNLAAGIAIGFAGVEGAVVRDCYIDGTYSDGIHLEWGSSNIIIVNNRFVGCATHPDGATITDLDRATINVFAQCHDVIISGNTIDQRPNTNTNGLHAITVRNYTGGVSLAGDPCVPPWRITITDNIIHCGENFGGIWACDIADLTIRGNRIIGEGSVASGVWDGGNLRYGVRVDGTRTVIADNAISGFRYGITGPLVEDYNGAAGVSLPLSARRALGNPGTVSGNIISDCYAGIVAVPAGAVTINNNRLFNLLHPLIVGENAYPAEPCSIIGNFASGCLYPLEVGGKHIVQRSAGGSTVTTGSGKTVNVDETLLKLPIGTEITFSGGGILTLTAAETGSQLYAAGSPHSLAGTVSGASIAANEYGIITGLAHSSTAANNFVTIEHNTDTAANRFLFAVPPDTDLPNGESVFARDLLTNVDIPSVNTVIRLTYFTAKKTETINAVRTITGSTAGVTPTLCRIGIYEEAANGNLTLVASTPNDTSLWTATYTTYTKSLSASFSKIAGRRYAVAVLVVGSATAPTFHGRYIYSDSEAAVSPRLAMYAVGASNLNSTLSSAGLNQAGARIYSALVT